MSGRTPSRCRRRRPFRGGWARGGCLGDIAGWRLTLGGCAAGGEDGGKPCAEKHDEKAAQGLGYLKHSKRG